MQVPNAPAQLADRVKACPRDYVGITTMYPRKLPTYRVAELVSLGPILLQKSPRSGPAREIRQ